MGIQTRSSRPAATAGLLAASMTESDKSPSESASEASTTEEQITDNRPAAAEKGSSGNGLALLALVAAVAALAASGWLYTQSQSSAPATDSSAELKSLERQLQQVSGKAEYNAEKALEAATRADRQQSETEALKQQFTQLQDGLSNLPQTDADVVTRFLQLETDWYLRLAETQLSVTGNYSAAREALLLADERLEQLANPRLVPVRNRIAAAVAELELQPQDRDAAYLETLDVIAASIPDWPLKQNVPTSFRGSEDEAADDAGGNDDDGWDRATAAVKDAFSGIISVRSGEDRLEPQLEEADVALLIRSIELDLQIAKLAILRNDTALTAQTLDSVRLRINTWFDAEDEVIQENLSRLDSLADGAATQAIPDITGIRAAHEQLLDNNG